MSPSSMSPPDQCSHHPCHHQINVPIIHVTTRSMFPSSMSPPDQCPHHPCHHQINVPIIHVTPRSMSPSSMSPPDQCPHHPCHHQINVPIIHVTTRSMSPSSMYQINVTSCLYFRTYRNANEGSIHQMLIHSLQNDIIGISEVFHVENGVGWKMGGSSCQSVEGWIRSEVWGRDT